MAPVATSVALVTEIFETAPPTKPQDALEDLASAGTKRQTTP